MELRKDRATVEDAEVLSVQKLASILIQMRFSERPEFYSKEIKTINNNHKRKCNKNIITIIIIIILQTQSFALIIQKRKYEKQKQQTNNNCSKCFYFKMRL